MLPTRHSPPPALDVDDPHPARPDAPHAVTVTHHRTAVLPAPHPFAPFVATRGVVVVDGALATELEARGADLADPLWSAKVLLEQPDLIAAVHADYLRAGADVLIAATYQATVEGFVARGLLPSEAVAIIRQAVSLACTTRDAFWRLASRQGGRAKPLVAASVGPYGAFLADGSEYRGDYALDEAALVAWHRERFALLVDSGADLLACETIPCRAEVRALLRLLDAHPTARAWITCSARDGESVSSGERFAEIAAEAGAHPQVVAVGINCTAPAHVAPLLRAARAVTSAPLIVYPNSGETYDAVAKRWTRPVTCAPYVDLAGEWHAAGAIAIGGCCRTTPADIAQVVAALAAPH